MLQAYEGNQPYVFVSYSHRDSAPVLEALEYLQNRGLRIWYDAGIEAGTEWPEYIASHLTGCAAVLAFVSDNFAASDNCRRELTFALNLKKPVLSAYLQDCQLSAGLQLQLGLAQALYLPEDGCREAFWEALAGAKIFADCGCPIREPAPQPKNETNPLPALQQRSGALMPLFDINGTCAIGLRADGSALCTPQTGGAQRVSSWSDLIAVCAGQYHVVGLCANGTVVCAGEKGKVSVVSGWQDIVAIAAGQFHTVGLKGDGTVLAAYSGESAHYVGQCQVDRWSGITAISASHLHTVGLRADGTVVAAGSNRYGQCQVEGWENIVAISAGHFHTVGLKADGTVVSTTYQGQGDCGQCQVESWRNIVSISAGRHHTVGLRADGTAVATRFTGWYDPWSGTGCSHEGQCQVDRWTDLVALQAGWFNTLGLKADGTLISTPNSRFPAETFAGWRLFESVDRREMEQIRKTRRRNQGLCLHCGGNFTGLFTKKCASCGKPKDY